MTEPEKLYKPMGEIMLEWFKNNNKVVYWRMKDNAPEKVGKLVYDQLSATDDPKNKAEFEELKRQAEAKLALQT